MFEYNSDEEVVTQFYPSEAHRYANGECSEEDNDEDDEDFQRRKKAASQVSRKHKEWLEKHNREVKERQELRLNEIRMSREKADGGSRRRSGHAK
jgi:hypothetical protein